MRAPCPIRMPVGLTRNPLPFDCRVPRRTEGSRPTTRLRTLLAALCWMKRVVSAAPIEKLCQLMIEAGEFVTLRALPCRLKLTCPFTTAGPVGFAYAFSQAKQETTAA